MTGAGSTYRVALDAVLRESAPQAAVYELLGERHLWWLSCGEATRADPAWLTEGPAEALADWIDANAPDREPSALTPARHAYLLARALASPPDQDEALVSVRALWADSGLLSANAAPGPVQPSGRGLDAVPEPAAARLGAVLERVPRLPGKAAPAPDSMLVTAVLLMAGCKPGRRVQIPVVFGETEHHGEPGATGVLELSEFPAGPPGLYPDPRYMAGLRNSDGQFATALGRAWAVAGRGRGARCVLWRLVFTDRSPTRVEGPSLGAAFALGLRELLRYPQRRRPSVAWLRGVFHGLRPRTAVTGALGHGERLDGVSGMEGKLLAARRKGLRLVAPAANRTDAAHAPEPADVRFAETLRQADRYARRFRTGRLVTAVVLVLAMVASGGVVRYREIVARERVAQAHRMAEVSVDLLSTDVTLAGLFAERAYRQHADAQTRKALFRAVTASPHLAGSVRAAGTVSAVAASQNGGRALTGSRGGDVEVWGLEGGRFTGYHRGMGRLPGPVEAVASDAEGRVVAASDGRTVGVWAAGENVAAPLLPEGRTPTAVAVSPSGRFVAVAADSSGSEVQGTLSVLDRDSGRTGHLELAGLSSAPSALAFDGDDELVVVDFAYGGWNRVSVPRLKRTAGSTVGFGVHNAAAALAPDGSHFAYSNKGSPLPVWASRGRPDVDRPGLVADTEPGLPSALAVSRGGTHAAMAIGSTLRVSRTHGPTGKSSRPLALPGAGQVSPGTLVFLGSGGDRLLSATSDSLTLWDLRQHTRIAWESKADIPGSCLSCVAPQVAVAPDGQDAAVLDGGGTRLALSRLGPPGTKPRGVEGTMRIPEFSTLVWRPDSSRLIVLAPDGRAEILARGEVWRPAGSWPAVPNPLRLSDPPALARYLPGGREVAEVHMSGTVWFRDARSGKPLRKVDGPRSMAPTADGFRHPATTKVALDEQGANAAVLDEPVLDDDGKARVHVISTGSGRVRTIPAAGARGLAYSGDHLLIQHGNGTVEEWSASGDRWLSTAEGVDDPAVGPVTDGKLLAGTAAEEQAVHLLDLASQTRLGALPLPEHNFANSTGLAFTPDGTGLVTATEADYSETDSPAPDGPTTDDLGTLIQWRLDPREWIRTVCATSGRELRPRDWEQHMDTPAPASLGCGE
ncbi:WD40 repeat domain-containing protein [Streptomyces sp. NPDC101115]|uniref:WD40 repeat domain-containing protein n=1 Tax=Streptomyces sp. NPDC101115 TaxID=3366106 RepID=UPI003801E059